MAGAQPLRAYHERKEAEWRIVEAQGEEEWRQSITMGETNDQSGERTTAIAQPQYNATKMNALHEEQAHRKDHQGWAAQYCSWANVLAAQPATLEVQLDYDDVVFLGLATGEWGHVRTGDQRPD